MNIIGQNGNDGIHYDSEELIEKNEEILATVKVEEPKKKEPIYNQFSRGYSDGVAANEDRPSNDDIKTY